MLLQRMEDASAYIALLESQRSELHALYRDLLIGVTSFFRDQEPFDLLSETILPAFLDKDRERPVRVWVPGCATGEEAYSIAICLLEQLEKQLQPRKLQVFATDINEDALTRARLGVYPTNIEASVGPDRLQRFFRRTTQGDYQVARQVRDAVVFARHNLGKDPPFSRLDLISCRNVLIYLQPALQRRVMRIFHYALKPQGLLMLGTAESVGETSDLFSLVDRKLKVYVKKHGASPGVFEFAFGPAAAGPAVTSSSAGERKVEVSFQQIIERKILDKYGPPGVAMDEALNILQFRGQCGPFLAPTPGAATLNILRMIRPELLAPLKAIAQRALTEGASASCEPVRLVGRESWVVMDVMPVEATSEGRCLLLVFRESIDAPQAPSVTPRDGSASQHEQGKRELELERELSALKEYQETIIQELATSNEELQSSNEELQSSNEELQSTNEELETSKEELQATNEELVTVNEELEARIDQLSVANDDVVNLLASSSAPMLLVDLDLRIRRFSSAAERLLNLIASDVGRPVSYLGVSLNAPQIEANVRDAINAIHPRELRVRCSNGAWYTMRTVPYQTSDRSVRGGVIELLPFPTLSGAYDTSDLHLLAGQVLATLPYQLVLVDFSLRIVWANDAFLGAWDQGEDLSGRPLDAVLGSRAALPDLWKRIDETVLSGQPFPMQNVTQAWGKQGERTMRWTARTVPVHPQRALTLFVIDEPARAEP
jgi:two-component system CheB/CheR fusion protein